ncbi:uncharacterized protein LOC135076088 [Ostrinia nubilalis]|uniref:uncharacterized protein LOC135076088 n=1 Tax=Ostrinia nubilalis TaxID=29057 RepID=UPI0030822A75
MLLKIGILLVAIAALGTIPGRARGHWHHGPHHNYGPPHHDYHGPPHPGPPGPHHGPPGPHHGPPGPHHGPPGPHHHPWERDSDESPEWSGSDSEISGSWESPCHHEHSRPPKPTPPPRPPNPEPNPNPFPQPTPQPFPKPTFNPNPFPQPTPQPFPKPTFNPNPFPQPTPVPFPGPNPNPTPFPQPTPVPFPGPNPNPTPFPQPTPVPFPGPNPNPTPFPQPTPVPFPGPNPNPNPFPKPTPVPFPPPTPTPFPQPTTESFTKSTVTPVPDLHACMLTCPVTQELNPVCGSNGEEYQNPGKLNCAKYCGVNVELARYGKCPTNEGKTLRPPPPRPERDVHACMRSCPVTSEYNPVCGSNGLEYSNPGRLNCAKMCGVNVNLVRRGRCPTNDGSTVSPPTPRPDRDVQACMRSCPVTSEYNPVCGSNGLEYSNPGRLNCAKMCGVNVELLRRGRCPPPEPTSNPITNPTPPVTVTESREPETRPTPPTIPPTKPTTPGVTFTIDKDLLDQIFSTTEETGPDLTGLIDERHQDD